MLDRQKNIIRALLQSLHEVDGGPVAETILHAAVNVKVQPAAMLSEFEEALCFCETSRWLTGIRGKLGTDKWSLTDAGEVARREIRNA